VATNWKSSKAYGPFCYLPEPPPWITDGGRAAAITTRELFLDWYLLRGEAWEDRPLGLLPFAPATGTQPDFGVGKLVDVFYSGMPFLIEAARYSAGEEAHRPVHHREADGSPVLAENHPMWVVVGGRTAWSASVSPDRLKPDPHPSGRDKTHGWTGKDHEHWSSLTLAAAYLLTGSHSLRMEVDNEIELYLASHTLPSMRPGLPSNHMGSGRAVGRTLLTMSWMYLVTGREDVAERMRRRIEECVVPQYVTLTEPGPVRPLRIRPPDARAISTGEQWVPWEEAQAVMGLEACHRVTGSENAHVVAFTVARNLILYGFRVDFSNTRVGYGIRWIPGGLPLLPHQLNDPEWAVWPSKLFNMWSLPATRLAIRWATTYGEPLMLSRAQKILTATEELREPPRVGPLLWDEYAEWDAVR